LRRLEVAARKISVDEGKEIKRELKIIHTWAQYRLSAKNFRRKLYKKELRHTYFLHVQNIKWRIKLDGQLAHI
jgi:hypothetical protein